MQRIGAVSLALGLALTAMPSNAQTSNTHSSLGQATNICRAHSSTKRPSYEIRRLEKNDIDSIKVELRNHCLPRALEIYLKSYRPELFAWVVYIARDGSVFQSLTKTESQDSTNSVYEQRYVWAIVFADRPLALPSEVKPSSPQSLVSVSAPNLALDVHPEESAAKGGGGGADTSDLILSRRVVMHRTDASVITLIKGLAKTIGLEGGTPDNLVDSTRFLSLQNASDEDHDSLYAAFGRFGLAENAEVELSIAPVAGKSFCAKSLIPGDSRSAVSAQVSVLDSNATCRSEIHSLQRVYTNFANAKRHSFEGGLLVGATVAGRTSTYNASLQQTGLTGRWIGNIYLAGIWNIHQLWFPTPWPGDRPSWQESSIGVFAATNILRGTLGDELVAGISVGHLLGDGGLDAGISFAPSQRLESGQLVSGRQRRLLLAFDLRL